jgi:hypothetical protein
VAAAVVAFLVAGCGGEGVDKNATLDVYASAPLCKEAKRQLAQEGPKVDSVSLRVVCLGPTRKGNRIDLAAIGANARRTVEDSSSIAYIGDPTQPETKFSESILEAAGIPQLPNQPGAKAMTRLIEAIRGAGRSDSLRGAVSDELSTQ